MNSSKWIWRSVGSVSIAATLLLLYGFIAAVRSITTPEPFVSTKPVNSGSSQIQNAPAAATQAGSFGSQPLEIRWQKELAMTQAAVLYDGR